MTTQSFAFGWKLTAALAAVAGLNLLVVCAALGSGVSWGLPVLVSAAAIGSAAAILLALSATSQLRAVCGEMLLESQQVAAALRELASVSQSTAQGAFQRTATLQQTSASPAEITAISRENAQSKQAAAGLMAEAGGPVNDGLVNHANRDLEELSRSMKEMNGSSEKFSGIIRVIDEFAFQTSILALNAAVEAASAGEAVTGFAVVADEVRNLAQRSGRAAKAKNLPIEEAIAKSGVGGAKLDAEAEPVRKTAGRATQVKALVHEADPASHKQSRGLEQIAVSAGQMEQVTQKNAACAESSAATDEELASHSRSLLALVDKLQSLCGASTAFEPVPSQARVKARRAPLPYVQPDAQPRRFPLDADAS
jgi:methyl-accepting chemotaxis protein